MIYPDLIMLLDKLHDPLSEPLRILLRQVMRSTVNYIHLKHVGFGNFKAHLFRFGAVATVLPTEDERWNATPAMDTQVLMESFCVLEDMSTISRCELVLHFGQWEGELITNVPFQRPHRHPKRISSLQAASTQSRNDQCTPR